jgi:hypothetical protein
MNVYRSRWGFHPCDYQTYLLLKQLNALYETALHNWAAWQRWARKLPHNRVIRRHLRNAQGETIGSEVVGPMPEPKLSALFCTRVHIRLKDGGTATGVTFDSLGVPEVYRAARTPAATPQAVTPLPWTEDEIRQLIARAEQSL